MLEIFVKCLHQESLENKMLQGIYNSMLDLDLKKTKLKTSKRFRSLEKQTTAFLTYSLFTFSRIMFTSCWVLVRKCKKNIYVCNNYLF